VIGLVHMELLHVDAVARLNATVQDAMGQAVPHGFIQSSEFAQWFSSNKVLIIS
jgi:hypothetical protein